MLSMGVAKAQHVGWPTPPPGEQFAIPSQAQVDRPVATSVERAGSQVAIVRPSWPGPLPIIPPVPADRISFTEADLDGPPPVLRIDAGTYPEVVQVRVSPASVGGIEAGRSQPLWAFAIEVFDADGRTYPSAPRRPLVLTLPVGAFEVAGVDPTYLSLASLEGRDLTPIVSTYRSSEGTITARLVMPATVVLLRDMP